MKHTVRWPIEAKFDRDLIETLAKFCETQVEIKHIISIETESDRLAAILAEILKSAAPETRPGRIFKARNCPNGHEYIPKSPTDRRCPTCEEGLPFP